MVPLIQQKIVSAANRYGVPPSEALKIGQIESNFNPSAVSSAGARGVMQLMPSTAMALGVDPDDVDQNIDGGVRYYAQLRQNYGDPTLAAAAYNAGPGRVDKYLAGSASLPSETQDYVHKFSGGSMPIDTGALYADPNQQQVPQGLLARIASATGNDPGTFNTIGSVLAGPPGDSFGDNLQRMGAWAQSINNPRGAAALLGSISQDALRQQQSQQLAFQRARLMNAMRMLSPGIANNLGIPPQIAAIAAASNDPMKIAGDYATKQFELTPEQKNAGVGPSMTQGALGGGVQPPAQAPQAQLQPPAAPPTAAPGTAANPTGNPVLNMKIKEDQAKQDQEQYLKNYQNYVQSAQGAKGLKDSIGLAKAVMDDPNFYSGVGADPVTWGKKLSAALGMNPNAAMSNEMFYGLIKNQILDQIKGLKGTGQIRNVEIHLIENALANNDHSWSGNRALLEIAGRLAGRQSAFGDIATGYQGAPGAKTQGLDTAVNSYLDQHPLFNKEELADTRTLGARQFNSKQDLLNANLPPGSPFKDPKGVIRYTPLQ